MSTTVQGLQEKVANVLDKYQNDSGLLVSILQDAQAEFGYLPREVLAEISTGLDIPLTRVYSVATFFKSFSLKPRGRHQVHVCMGTACHVRGATRILDTLERETGLRPGETDDALKYSLETVNCVGACALGPIVIVDGKYSGEMTIGKVKPLLDSYE